jgi:hypothetical protein
LVRGRGPPCSTAQHNTTQHHPPHHTASPTLRGNLPNAPGLVSPHTDPPALPSLPAPSPFQSSRVVCVAAGDWHNAAITADGALFVWGRGDCGQLGHGDDRSRWAPKLLERFQVIHPDRTLRRNRKPVLKALILPAEEGAGGRAAAPRQGAAQGGKTDV